MEDDDRHGWYLLLAHSNGYHTVGETRPMPSGANWPQPCQPQTLAGLPVPLAHPGAWGTHTPTHEIWSHVAENRHVTLLSLDVRLSLTLSDICEKIDILFDKLNRIQPSWLFTLYLFSFTVNVSRRCVFRRVESFRQHHFGQLLWPRPHPLLFLFRPHPYSLLKLVLWRQCSFLRICQQLLFRKSFHQ